MKFFKGYFLCWFVISLLTFIIEQLTIQPNSGRFSGVMIVVYIPIISLVGCLLGEVLQFILTKAKIKITIIQFLCFILLGFICGFIVIKLFIHAKVDMSLPLVSALGSISFYIGRNFWGKMKGEF